MELSTRPDRLNLGDASMTVNEYFKKKGVAGVLVIKDGHILYERYGLGNKLSTYLSEKIWRPFGIFGQGIYIDRNENVIIALHSARFEACGQ